MNTTPVPAHPRSWPFRSRRRSVAAVAILAALAAGCGSDDEVATPTTDAAPPSSAASTTTAPTSTPPTSPTETDAPAPAGGSITLADTDAGSVLVDGNGMSLYLFTNDTEGVSACSDGCAQAWPPLVAPVTAGDGIDAAQLTTITRDDGVEQVAYFGHPLYTFASDAAPGDINGQGQGDVWYLVDADGEQAPVAAADLGGAGY